MAAQPKDCLNEMLGGGFILTVPDFAIMMNFQSALIISPHRKGDGDGNSKNRG
jgi:hypothetical protein